MTFTTSEAQAETTLQGFTTRAIHVGSQPDPATNAVIPSISLSTTFKQDAIGSHKGYEYSRSQNPSRHNLEIALAALEAGGAQALAFASGSATTATVIQTIVGRGGHIISVNDVYGGTYRYIKNVASDGQGVDATFLDLESISEEDLVKELRPETKLVWIETPTNPTLRIIDLKRITSILTSQYERNGGTRPMVLVDNTFASPFFQSPLLNGADMVLHSLTKYINGHSDVVGGALIVPSSPLHDALYARLQYFQNAIGAIPSPFDSWLVQRGAKTLGVRMREHGLNAMRLARWLSFSDVGRYYVKDVIYPGLPSHPSHQTAYAHLSPHALKWMATLPSSMSVGPETGFPFSGMVSFRIKGGAEAAEKFLQETKLFTLAESLGGVESLAEVPARMTHGSIPLESRLALGITDDLIRLSVGIEDIEDLLADVEQALKIAVPSSDAILEPSKLASALEGLEDLSIEKIADRGASGSGCGRTPPPEYADATYHGENDEKQTVTIPDLQATHDVLVNV